MNILLPINVDYKFVDAGALEVSVSLIGILLIAVTIIQRRFYKKKKEDDIIDIKLGPNMIVEIEKDLSVKIKQT